MRGMPRKLPLKRHRWPARGRRNYSIVQSKSCENWRNIVLSQSTECHSSVAPNASWFSSQQKAAQQQVFQPAAGRTGGRSAAAKTFLASLTYWNVSTFSLL